MKKSSCIPAKKRDKKSFKKRVDISGEGHTLNVQLAMSNGQLALKKEESGKGQVGLVVFYYVPSLTGLVQVPVE